MLVTLKCKLDGFLFYSCIICLLLFEIYCDTLTLKCLFLLISILFKTIVDCIILLCDPKICVDILGNLVSNLYLLVFSNYICNQILNWHSTKQYIIGLQFYSLDY